MNKDIKIGYYLCPIINKLISEFVYDMCNGIEDKKCTTGCYAKLYGKLTQKQSEKINSRENKLKRLLNE